MSNNKCKISSCNTEATTKKGFCKYHYFHNDIRVEDSVCRMTVFCKDIEYITTFNTQYLEKVKRYKWYIDNRGYIVTNIKTENDKKTLLQLHQLIRDTPKELETDHINHDKLDNRDNNLRICSHKENQRNQKNHRKNTSSHFKGVCWNKLSKKWQSYIKYNLKQVYLGLFDKEIEAAKAYDIAAIKYFKEYALLNFFNKSKLNRRT